MLSNFYLLILLFSFFSHAGDLKFESVEAVSCSPKIFGDDIGSGDVVAAYFLKDVNSDKWYASLGYADFGLFGMGQMNIDWTEPFEAESEYSPVPNQKCEGCSFIKFKGEVSGKSMSLKISEYFDYGWNEIGGGYSIDFVMSGTKAEINCGVANLSYDLNWADEAYTVILKELMSLSGQAVIN